MDMLTNLTVKYLHVHVGSIPYGKSFYYLYDFLLEEYYEKSEILENLLKANSQLKDLLIQGILYIVNEKHEGFLILHPYEDYIRSVSISIKDEYLFLEDIKSSGYCKTTKDKNIHLNEISTYDLAFLLQEISYKS